MLQQRQGVGLVDFEFLIIEGLDLASILPISRRMDTLYATEHMYLRLSFYDASLDTEHCPIIYSAEKKISKEEIASLEPL